MRDYRAPPELQTFLQDDIKELIALAEAQATTASRRRGIPERSDQGLPASQRAGAGYYLASRGGKVGEIELRVLLPPGCSRDLSVEVKPAHHGQGQEDWFTGPAPERNSWTSIVDVGPQLPGDSGGAFGRHADDVLDALDEVAES